MNESFAKKQIGLALQIAQQVLDEGGEVSPQAVLINLVKNEVHMVMVDTSTVEAKDQSAAVIRQLAKKVQAGAVVFFAESWTLSREDAEAYMKSGFKFPISQHPNRKECVHVSVETHLDMWTARAMIETVNGKRKLTEPEIIQSPKSEGRFANFLGVKLTWQ